MNSKQKSSLIIEGIVFGAVVGILAALIANAMFLYDKSMGLGEYVTLIMGDFKTILVPFQPLSILIGVGICVLVAAGHYFSKINAPQRMIGKEFGSAEWGDPKEICKKFAAKNIHENRLLSQNLRINYDGYTTRLNSNGIVLGGSGTGKTFFVMTPNLLNLHGSNVYTDPKGGLLDDMGNYLVKNNVVVRSINLVDMAQSDHFNPFEYIHKEADVTKLITNLLANTTEGGASSKDPFWDKAETLFLQGIFSYVWLECPRKEIDVQTGEEIVLPRNFRTVIKLLSEAEVPQKASEKSPLTKRMDRLVEEKGPDHPAARSYYKCIRGAGDTVRSIIISANARFAPFDNEQLLELLDSDDLHLPWIGEGWNCDGKTKTALFCIIPDDDSTFNFVPGMLYTLLFQELYATAKKYHNKLPLDVGFWFDEFANISMPSSFDKIVATCRSRKIYVTIVLQSMAQIKTLYEKEWEGIVGNCDTLTYLGGNEDGTHKYISEALDKQTIEKASRSSSKGKNGSTSESRDFLGRELMTKGEVRMLPNEECIVLVRSCRPVRDLKIQTDKMPEFKKAMAMGPFIHGAAANKNATIYKAKGKLKDRLPGGVLNAESARILYDEAEAERKKNKDNIEPGDDIITSYINNFDLSDVDIKVEIVDGHACVIGDHPKDMEAFNYPPRYSTIMETILSTDEWTPRQIYEMRDGLQRGLSEEEVLYYAMPEIPADKMREMANRMLEDHGMTMPPEEELSFSTDDTDNDAIDDEMQRVFNEEFANIAKGIRDANMEELSTGRDSVQEELHKRNVNPVDFLDKGFVDDLRAEEEIPDDMFGDD